MDRSYISQTIRLVSALLARYDYTLLSLSCSDQVLIFVKNVNVPGQQNQPKPEPSPIVESPAREVTDEDKNVLQNLLGEETAQAVMTLYDTIVAAGTTRLDSTANSVKFPQMEREVRGKVHKVGCLFHWYMHQAY